MLAMARNAVMSLILFTILTGIVYPLVVTGIAQVVFPHQANGSIVTKDGQPVGSELSGRSFDDPKYFWGRPSATGPYPYNGGASSGSNLGPNNPSLMAAVEVRVRALRTADPANGKNEKIPVDLVTASGSGLDPDISPAAAFFQAGRVARARGRDESAVRKLVSGSIEGRQLGILGEPRVNVLALNMALDGLGK